MSSGEGDYTDSAVQDFLEILEEHRKNCEKQGKYVEAEIAKNRLEELKLHEENRRREAMRSRQIAERLGVEEAHMLEFQQFNKVRSPFAPPAASRASPLRQPCAASRARCLAARRCGATPYPRGCRGGVRIRTPRPHLCHPPAPFHFAPRPITSLQMWDQKELEYKERAQRLLSDMKMRHQAEMQTEQQRLVSKQPNPKFSKELLNYRRIQDHLAKQRNYVEAHRIKLKADTLETWELDKMKNKRQQDMFQKEAKFKHRQKMELKALKQRIVAGQKEQRKQRQLNLERLLQRYQNVKRELESNQTRERIQADRYSSLGRSRKSGGKGTMGGSKRRSKRR